MLEIHIFSFRETYVIKKCKFCLFDQREQILFFNSGKDCPWKRSSILARKMPKMHLKRNVVWSVWQLFKFSVVQPALVELRRHNSIVFQSNFITNHKFMIAFYVNPLGESAKGSFAFETVNRRWALRNDD